MPAGNAIRIFHAREHNLKNVSVTIPRNRLVLITGLSGSGKSSLAFDTLYAEGQRRYVESLSAYARQFLEVMGKPDVERIEGLSPAISIEQKSTSRNPRSTVGTVTEIHDYMRLLYARIGVPHSPATGLPIESQSVSEMVDKILTLPEGTRLYLLAPIVRGRKGEYRKEFADLRKQGFQRVRVDGELYELEAPPSLDKNRKHDIEVVVDRLVLRGDIATRLADSLELTLRLADGIALAESAPDGKGEAGGKKRAKPVSLLFSSRFACPVSGFTIEEIEPRLFSFNSPFGACPSCGGLGVMRRMDAELVVPDTSRSLAGGAIAPWARSTAFYYRQTLEAVARHYGFSMEVPWKALPKQAQDAILYGSGNDKIEFIYSNGEQVYKKRKPFEGILPHLERRYRETDSSWAREDIEQYQTSADCAACTGFRLKPEALAVKIADMHIGEVARFSIREAIAWFAGLDKRLRGNRREIAARILKEICDRLQFLDDVGLEYLSLARASATLSGGESQRIRLASQIGSGLTGVLYVLDEPSIGLHQRDNARLLGTLRRLCALENTVLVVEHDEEAILAADHVLEMGPGAGIHGGEVVAQGTPDVIKRSRRSMTGQYLSGRRSIPIPERRRAANPKRMLEVTGASGNNLRDLDVQLPLGLFVCITGVSGGGKSTLLLDTIYRAAVRRLHGARERPAPFAKLRGLEHIDKVIDIDQSPIGRTPRSNPATYTGAFAPIREWFAELPEARARGYKSGRFSFNVAGGRCEECQGDGLIRIEMHFLPDIYVTCDRCRGKRYNRETLEILFRGKSIADVLDMSVEEAREFFKAVPAVRAKMETLSRVGLDYIRLGQQATTLSGGEAQRIKLAKELSRRATGRTLYILDEPTTGLHFHDVAKLLQLLHELVGSGNTVAVIEHNLEVIKTADWIIDLGPEGGDGGGTVVAAGTPEQVAQVKASHTGAFLRAMLKRRQAESKAGAQARPAGKKAASVKTRKPTPRPKAKRPAAKKAASASPRRKRKKAA